MVQQIVHKVIVNGEDISHHVSNISVTSMEMDSYPVGRIQLANPIGIYTADPDNSPMYRRNDVEIWASKDGGASYIRLLDGVITQPNATVSASGQSTMTLECIGGKNLDQMVISPNCAVIGARENIGDVFKGRATDVRGVAWTADADGNYPDGLLYKTGYEYDGVSSLFDDDWDFPSNHSTGTYNIYNTIKNICKLYGLVFFIDDNNSKVTVLRKPSVAAFDQTTAFSFERGRNIEGVKDDSDQRRKYDKVVVIGSGVHAIVGSGLRTYVHNDSEISDYSTAVAVANSMAANMIQTSEDPKWHETKITTGPVTAQIVGKSILVKDKMFLDGPTWRNCVGVSHTIANGRWTSEVSLESSSFTVGKTLAEVIEEAGGADTTSGIAFLSAFDPEIDSDVLAYNCTPGAIVFGKQGDDNYYLDLLGNTFVGSDGKIMSLNYLTSGNYNERMDEVSIIFNDYGYLPVKVVEDGTEYASYTAGGSAVVTDGVDHIIQTTSGVNQYQLKNKSFSGTTVTDDMAIRFDMESNTTQIVTITFGYNDPGIGADRQCLFQVPVVAGVRKQFSIRISNGSITNAPFNWSAIAYVYFLQPSISVLKVYNVEIGTVDVLADTIGQTESIEEEFSVNLLPSTRTIYTDASERNWLKLGTLSKNYPYQITTVFADGYSPTGAPDLASDPYMYQWMKPIDAVEIGFFAGTFPESFLVSSDIPAPGSVLWNKKYIDTTSVSHISTFNEIYADMVHTSSSGDKRFLAVMFKYNTGFIKDINDYVHEVFFNGLFNYDSATQSLVSMIYVVKAGHLSAGWALGRSGGVADGTNTFTQVNIPSILLDLVEDDGEIYVGWTVCPKSTDFTASPNFKMMYSDLGVKYDITYFKESNIYTVIEAVNFECVRTRHIGSSGFQSYWEGNTSFNINSFINVNDSAEWNEVTQMYENPRGVYMSKSSWTDPTGGTRIECNAKVVSSIITDILGRSPYVAKVGDTITQYVTYTVRMENRMDLPTVQNFPPSKILFKVNPLDATKQDIYMRLDASAPSHQTLLSVYYDYVGGEIGATFVPSSTGRIDQGIDMGVSKTVNVQTRLDLTKTDVSPEPGVIDGLGCDAVVVAP